MTDKVYVNIKGLQLTMPSTRSESENESASEVEEDTDPIEVINVGKYKVVNGKEYVKYEELYEGEAKKCSNIIRISDGNVEITKKGVVTAHLSFVKGEKTMTCYETPYGNIYLGVFSRNVDIKRSHENIKIAIDYALELNYEQVSDCQVEIEISSKGRISLQ